MGRLIDEDEAIQRLKVLEDAPEMLDLVIAASVLPDAAEEVHRCRTVDAVTVVRCKDCMHRGTVRCRMFVLRKTELGMRPNYMDLTKNDGYCEEGEKHEAD